MDTPVQDLKRGVLEMDKYSVSEMKSYSAPPAIVKRVMQGAMLLLIGDEQKTSDWRYVQRLLNPQGLQGMKRKIMDFNAATVHPDIAARVRYILEYQYDEPKKKDPNFDPCHYGLGKVQSVSLTAATFYLWAMGVLNEVESPHRG